MNYKKVYFRINTPMYYNSKYGVGWGSPEEGQLFDVTIKNIFIKDGWRIKENEISDGCTTVINCKQELYLHPQSISGVVLIESIPHIEDLLSNNDIFELERTDIYEDVFDITDDEYINLLKSKKEYIKQDILEACKTKRSNLYITDSWGVISNVTNKYRIKRLSNYIGVVSSDNIDIQYISELFESLVNKNKIITADTKHGIGYRTDKKFLKSA